MGGLPSSGIKEVKVGMIHFEDGRGHGPENVYMLEKLEKAKRQIPPPKQYRLYHSSKMVTAVCASRISRLLDCWAGPSHEWVCPCQVAPMERKVQFECGRPSPTSQCYPGRE